MSKTFFDSPQIYYYIYMCVTENTANYVIQILRTPQPLGIYNSSTSGRDDAIAFLNNFTKHKIGQIVEVLYYRSNTEDDYGHDPVSCLTAIGLKNWNECGPSGEYNDNRWLNKQYNTDVYPNGPCGVEFYHIIGDTSESSSSTITQKVYKINSYWPTGVEESPIPENFFTLEDYSSYVTDSIQHQKVGYTPEDGDVCTVEVTVAPGEYIYYMYIYSTDEGFWKPLQGGGGTTYYESKITLSTQGVTFMTKNGSYEYTDPIGFDNLS